MTLDRKDKRAPVPFGNISSKGIPDDILDTERRYVGIFCLIDGTFFLVRPNDESMEVIAEEGVVQWIAGQPDRVHANIGQAIDFVRGRILN
jgi:hypothetical protein